MDGGGQILRKGFIICEVALTEIVLIVVNQSKDWSIVGGIKLTGHCPGQERFCWLIGVADIDVQIRVVYTSILHLATDGNIGGISSTSIGTISKGQIRTQSSNIQVLRKVDLSNLG